MKMESPKEIIGLIIVLLSSKRCFTHRNNNSKEKKKHKPPTTYSQITISELNFKDLSWLILFNHFFFSLSPKHLNFTLGLNMNQQKMNEILVSSFHQTFSFNSIFR